MSSTKSSTGDVAIDGGRVEPQKGARKRKKNQEEIGLKPNRILKVSGDVIWFFAPFFRLFAAGILQ